MSCAYGHDIEQKTSLVISLCEFHGKLVIKGALIVTLAMLRHLRNCCIIVVVVVVVLIGKLKE